jgi:hypothetical protein
MEMQGLYSGSTDSRGFVNLFSEVSSEKEQMKVYKTIQRIFI